MRECMHAHICTMHNSYLQLRSSVTRDKFLPQGRIFFTLDIVSRRGTGFYTIPRPHATWVIIWRCSIVVVIKEWQVLPRRHLQPSLSGWRLQSVMLWLQLRATAVRLVLVRRKSTRSQWRKTSVAADLFVYLSSPHCSSPHTDKSNTRKMFFYLAPPKLQISGIFHDGTRPHLQSDGLPPKSRRSVVYI